MLMECRELGLGLDPGYGGDGLRALAAAGEPRQHFECGPRRTETA